MKILVLCAILVYSGGFVKADGNTGCEVTDAALAELEELKALVDQLTTLVETIIGGPIPEPEPFVIINPVLTVTWKEAKLTWTPPEGVIGYTATLNTTEGVQPVVRLSPFEESFTTTDITVGQEYTIKIIPIKGDGPGEAFISEVFVPVCPMICTLEFRPQCGTDGTTYSNPCSLEIAQCERSDTTLELAYEGECEPEPFVIINPVLTVTWKEAKLTWTPPEGVIGYTATLNTPEGVQPHVRLSPFEESFTTTDITVGQEYTIKIVPIKQDGPGEAFISDVFVPVCPMICTFEFRPQCGTDGMTYSNPCALEIAQCEGSDTTLELAYEGACDPCFNVQCDPPMCPDGFVLGSTPLPGECCVGCVDECSVRVCPPILCQAGFVETEIEGECCPECVVEDPCFNVQCDPPMCPDEFVVGSTPPPGECCVGCVDECAGTVCPTLQCQPGFIETEIEGECCPECMVEVFADCSAALTSGKTTSGKYMLRPAGAPAPFEAVCDMDSDGGGWTVILVRDSTGGNFYRDMADYVAGFGDLDGSHWLGLKNLYLLNKQGNIEMVVDVTDQSGTSDVATYRNFRIGNVDTNYTLQTVSGYRGGAGNALFYNKGAPFSARDLDNDNVARNCAEEMVGGWWYRGGMCSRSNPLGEYRTRAEFESDKGIFWAPFRGKKHSLSYISMKIRDPTA